MKKVYIIALLALLLPVSLKAQIDDGFGAVSDFQRFRDSIFNDFEDFRRKANEEYANFMRRPWVKEPTQPPVAPPEFPKPQTPPVVDPKTRPTSDPIPFDGKLRQPKLIDRPEPVVPIKLTPRPQDPVIPFLFFGTPMQFHFDKSKTLHLNDVSENSVANLWEQLSESYYDNLIAECLQYREKHNLCDWAYVLLTKKVAETCCGESSNESVVVHMYLLTQSGFNVRIARANRERLTVLLGSTEIIYGYKYFNLEGMMYYILDRSLNDAYFTIFKHAFPKEKPLSLSITQPKLSIAPTRERTLSSVRFKLKATVGTNQNLIDFYNTYPLSSEWHLYSKASLSQTIKEDLYPVLQSAIKNKSEFIAADMLIDFVQTGFDYKTDNDQFGYERPLFPDESFYYPYCDCEDRSILFACLVRELMGLDVVLLHYPKHLATAVRFKEEVNGDYLMIDGVKYVICDPTYIGARIGMCMPEFKQVSPIVQKF